MAQDLCPRQVNLNCPDCMIISGALIEPCDRCLHLRFMEEVDSDDDMPVIKKKQLTPKEIAMKEFNKRMAQEKREAKIRACEEKKAAKQKALWEKLAFDEIAKFKNIFENITHNNVEYEILREIMNTNVNKGLSKFNKFYNKEACGSATRGPINETRIANLITYNKPEGFFGIALPVKAGNWLANDGNSEEWIVAYHGTGLQATKSILASELRPGPGQSFKCRTNQNPLSAPGLIDTGIFCTPDLPEAIAHNRASNFVVILQCRVNPNALKVADNIHWVVNEGKNIIPYKLLIKMR